MSQTVLTVSQVNFFIKSLLEGDGRLQNVLISGEISNFTDHYRSGHLYFSLKDDKSVLKAVMFASAARRLKFRPKDGMKVLIRGRVSVYEPSGQYQLYAEDMQPEGMGALSLAFQQLKDRLSQEGLFDPGHKREIPAFPQRIGVITSPTGAAVQDILQITGRRWPLAEIVLAPVLVQGEQAPGQIVEALQEMDRRRACDVIILGRGRVLWRTCGPLTRRLWPGRCTLVRFRWCPLWATNRFHHLRFCGGFASPYTQCCGGAVHPRLAGGTCPGAFLQPVFPGGIGQAGGVPPAKRGPLGGNASVEASGRDSGTAP